MKPSFFNIKFLVVLITAIVLVPIKVNAQTRCDLDFHYVHPTNSPPSGNYFLPGDDMEITYRIVNGGPDTSDSYTIDYYIATDYFIYSTDHWIGSTDRDPLAADTAEIYTKTIPVPYGLPIGFYFVGAIFTCSNDRDRSNNALSTSGHAILVPWPTDISVQPVDADGDVYLPGESIIVRIEIEGIGGHLDTSFEIDVYASTDLMITTSDYKIHSYEGETISPGESRLLSEACQLPSDIPAGDYYIGIIITYLVEDGTDSTTYNDHNTVYIGGYLDLVVQSVGITPGAYQPGQEFVVYNLIKNVGGGNAKSYTVDYYA